MALRRKIDPTLSLIRYRASRSVADTSPKSSERLRGFSTYLRVKLRSGRTKSGPEDAGLEDASVPRIFGVPLRTSIVYANVAVSLFNETGESYIYGYLPIVVAKTGVYLKEHGMFCVERVGQSIC